MELERRLVSIPCEVRCERQSGGKNRHVITGYAATFETESRMLPGGFIETIRRGAFDEVMAAGPDVIGVYNHDKNFLLGRTANGTMKLSLDDRGLKYEIYPPESRMDVVESIERGDVVGSSFAFKVPPRGESWGETARGIRRRSIEKVGFLEDVGPVVRPAYESASVVVSRRAIEEAVGESFRPRQTMANAAKRGLKLAAGRSDIDPSLLTIAERLQKRQIVSPEEVGYLMAAHQRLAEMRSASWDGKSAWIEYQLAGGDSGEKWLQRRMKSPVFSFEDDLEERDDGLRPPAGMAAAARRGLELHKEGHSGDGLKPETVSRAGRIAAREPLTESHVREMDGWFARHEVDRKDGWDSPPTPGYVAHLLWGGDPGKSWSAKMVAQMEKTEGRDEGEPGSEYSEESAGELSPQNYDLFEAIKQIATREGPWSQDAGDGAHYLPDSPFAEKGIRCENCIFWNTEGSCDVVEGDIAPGGICKLWSIPEDRMTSSDQSQPPKLEGPPMAEPPMAKRCETDAALTAAAKLKAQSLESAAIGRL
jgi:hypothetical protein